MQQMLAYFEAKEILIKANMKKKETKLTRVLMMVLKIVLSTALLFAVGLFAADRVSKG